ncbi:MAG: invasion associated locus B family protein [Ruegeria sp.]|uniref:invasion associated locus B family protein n=1 Tax=Ruegeria sp. TaxID=1879320 RepID=UPI00349F04C3
MFKNPLPVCVLALTAWSHASFAQEAAAPTDSTDATEQSTDGQSAGASEVLDLGQPVQDGETPVGQRYSREKHGDWDLACVKTQSDEDPCSLLQILNGPEGNPMAEFSMFRLEGRQVAVAGATVIVPLETLLPAQLTISVDGGPGKRYNYSYCAPVGCIAQIGLTQEDINAMKKGTEATISLVPAPAPDQVITLKMSLKGFTAGYNVVDVVSN